MGKQKNGRRPAASTAAFSPPAEPPDYNELPPKFCLNFLQDGFDVHALETAGQAEFAKTLQKLAGFRWKDLITAPRHGCGTELITADQIKAPIPPRFQDQAKFMVFRYNGLLPMAGVRIRDVFHVLWIEPWFGKLYDHE